MSVTDVLAHAEEPIKQVVASVGSKIILKYGPYLLKTIFSRKIAFTISSVIVFNFFSREEYENASKILRNIINEFRRKEDNKNLLLIDNMSFEYYLDISYSQDDLAIARILEDSYYAYLSTEPFEEKIETTLLASSARLYFKPASEKMELELDKFKTMLEAIFKFYRNIDNKILGHMRDGFLGSTKTSLHVIFKFEEKDFLKNKKVSNLIASDIKGNIKINLKESKIEALIDDSTVIENLIKMFR
ncbi:MAG: hypothetical protein QXE05_00210 [Nitrososphaeria archaeon]